MNRTACVHRFIVALCLVVGWALPASAQPHGIAQNRFLSPEKSMKSIQPRRLGLSNDSTKLGKKAAVAGLSNQGQGKSLALRNGFGPKNSQVGVGQLQPLKNKQAANRHPREENWATAFEGIEVKAGPSRGKIATVNSLRSGSSQKEILSKQTSHGMSGDGWSRQIKETEGLK